MTDSTSDEQLIEEGHRLHRAIVAWGQKHGVQAYRVLTADDAWFEFYDAKTKTLSRDFPPKIREAIEANAAALKAYAAATRNDVFRANMPLPSPGHRFWPTTDTPSPTTAKVSDTN